MDFWFSVAVMEHAQTKKRMFQQKNWFQGMTLIAQLYLVYGT